MRRFFWRIFHSWWLLLSLIPFGLTSFLAFFYVGFMAKRLRWKVYGVLYTSILFIFLSASTSSSETWSTVLLVSWVISIVHLFVIRAPYLEALNRTNRKKRKRTIKKSKHIKRREKTSLHPPVKKEVSVKPMIIKNDQPEPAVFKRDIKKQARLPKTSMFDTKEKRLRKELKVQILTHSSSLRLIKKVYDQTGTLNHMILVSFKEKLVRTLRTEHEFNRFSDHEIENIIEEETKKILNSKEFHSNYIRGLV